MPAPDQDLPELTKAHEKIVSNNLSAFREFMSNGTVTKSSETVAVEQLTEEVKAMRKELSEFILKSDPLFQRIMRELQNDPK